MLVRLGAWLVLGFWCCLAGCRSVAPSNPWPTAAEEALERASVALALDQPDLLPQIEADLLEARRLAPGWIAAERLWDELARARLLLPQAFRERQAALDLEPHSALNLYLVARHTSSQASELYERALALDPRCAFAHHGLAILAQRERRMSQALARAQTALECAQGRYERGFFAIAWVRTLLRAGDEPRARQQLAELLETLDLGHVDRLRLRAQATSLALGEEQPQAAIEEALALIRDPALPLLELETLSAALSLLAQTQPGLREEWLWALSAVESSERSRLQARAGLWPAPTALSLARYLATAPEESPYLRLVRFQVGLVHEAVEAWLRALPQQVLDERGLPRNPALAQLVLRARAGELSELGPVLLEVGWYDEALALAQNLNGMDLGTAAQLEQHALQGQALLARSVRVATHAPNLDRALKQLDLAQSPRLSFGPLGSLVHPGPWFSAADQRAGLGTQGQPVPGLAAWFHALGRFALMGEIALRAGIDAAILPCLWVERAGGELLGRSWSGTIAWCEGQDLAPLVSRSGAKIHAAALHEGFWLDIDSVRQERAEWLALERRFADPKARSAALNVAPLPTAGPIWAIEPTLGAGDRLRLAVIQERGVPSLEEFIDATATHEAAHVLDRQRFLPLQRHWTRALALLAECGFSPLLVIERLEARAQLVGLAQAREPRILLAQLLDAAEGEFGRELPHAQGYRDLLRELLESLADHPAWERSCLMVQQLQRLGAADWNHAAGELARRWRLDQP